MFPCCITVTVHKPINSTSDTQHYYNMSDSQIEIQWYFMQHKLACIIIAGWEAYMVIKSKVYLICTEALTALEHQWRQTMGCSNQLAIYSHATLLKLVT